MKKYGYVLLLLMLQNNSSFAVEVFSRLKERSVEKINEISKGAQQLLGELQELKGCWAKDSCTKEQYDRIKSLGKKIAVGTVALIALAAGAAIGWQRTRPTVENAIRKFNVKIEHVLTGSNDNALIQAVSEKNVDKVKNIITNDQRYFSPNGLGAAQWLANELYLRGIYDQVTEFRKEAPMMQHESSIPLVVQGRIFEEKQEQ